MQIQNILYQIKIILGGNKKKDKTYKDNKWITYSIYYGIITGIVAGLFGIGFVAAALIFGILTLVIQ